MQFTDDVLLEVLNDALGQPSMPKLLVSIPIKEEKCSNIFPVVQTVEQTSLIVQNPIAKCNNSVDLFCATCRVSRGSSLSTHKEKICTICHDTLKIRCLTCGKNYASIRSAYGHFEGDCRRDNKKKLGIIKKQATKVVDDTKGLVCTKCGKKYKKSAYFWKHKCII